MRRYDSHQVAAESSCRWAEHHFGETTLGDQLGVVVAAEVRGWRSRKLGGEQPVDEGLADADSLAHRQRQEFGQPNSSCQRFGERSSRQEPGRSSEQVLAPVIGSIEIGLECEQQSIPAALKLVDRDLLGLAVQEPHRIVQRGLHRAGLVERDHRSSALLYLLNQGALS